MLYVDEVNLLPDHLVDVLLDVAISGINRVEREGVSHTHPSRFVLIGSMSSEEGDLVPSSSTASTWPPTCWRRPTPPSGPRPCAGAWPSTPTRLSSPAPGQMSRMTRTWALLAIRSKVWETACGWLALRCHR